MGPEPPEKILIMFLLNMLFFQTLNKMFSPKNIWMKYEPSNSFFGEIREWLVFGSSIEKLCKGVPVYKVERVESEYEEPKCSFV